MSRAADVGMGLMLIIGSVVWLSFFGLIGLFASAFGAESIFWTIVVLVAIAAGIGSLAGGFHTAAGVTGARWSLIVSGGLWATLWLFDLPYLDSDNSAAEWLLAVGNVAVGLSTIAAGVWFRGVLRALRRVAA